MYSKKEYDFIKFTRSPRKNKKYRATLEHKKTGKAVHIDFGDSRYEQYKDTTGLRLFSHNDHLDKKRRTSYRARFSGLPRTQYSPHYFSWKFLW
jgi:hypothetical protein